MPQIDGRQVATGIKEISPATPVVLLTGWGQRMASDRELPPHVDFILSKPARLKICAKPWAVSARRKSRNSTADSTK